MADIKDKVILLHTSGSTSTSDAKNSATLTGNTFSQGEIAIITKDDDEALLIKNQGGKIVEFPTAGKVDKAITDAIDASVTDAIDAAVTVEKNRAEGVESGLRTDVDSKLSGITANDASVTVNNTTATNPKLNVAISKTDGNHLSLNSDGLFVTNVINCGEF